jgi:hypothetical protein
MRDGRARVVYFFSNNAGSARGLAWLLCLGRMTYVCMGIRGGEADVWARTAGEGVCLVVWFMGVFWFGSWMIVAGS